MDCTTNINMKNRNFASYSITKSHFMIWCITGQIDKNMPRTDTAFPVGNKTYKMHVIQGFHHSIFTYSNTFLWEGIKNGLFTLPGAKQMFLGSENFCFVFISCTARFFVNFENLRNISICKPDIQPIFSRGSESTKMARWLNIENDIKKLVYQITGFQVLM